MNKVTRYILIGIAAVTLIGAVVVALLGRNVPMDSFLAIGNGENGTSVVAWYEDEKTVISQINSKGKIGKYISFDTIDGDTMYTIEGVAAGSQGTAYALRNVKNCYDGSLLEQQLLVLDFTGLRGSINKVFTLTDETENYLYKFISATGETVSLIAADMYESSAVRRIYEYGSLLSGALTIKSTRTYPLEEGQGIYSAIGNSTDLVYISDSGKIFKADEETVTEIYPARVVESLMYPTFIAYAESGYIYMGEHESGNLIRLDLANGEETVVQSGNAPLNGATVYTAKNFLKMSMTNLNSYTAVVESSVTNKLQILIAQDGVCSVVMQISYSFFTLLLRIVGLWVTYFVIVLAGYGVLYGLLAVFRNGRTMMTRLVAVTTPLIIIAMLLFGVIAYNYYKQAIEENFDKQVVDEGNMLTALFGQESFNEIEYPYDYNGEAYAYLKNQLDTREVYSRVVYYENSNLYVGVDEDSPCFYPYGILMDTKAEELYRKAAITGNEVTGTIQDKAGERLVCITPVGGLSGQTVYLLETGIFTMNLNAYMRSYIGNFGIICGSFLIILVVLLGMAFYRVLLPISDMKWKMERYAQGDVDERITVISEDELGGISSVFNKMADDYEVQIHNLEKMGNTYYRFVPTGIISLLNKDNLADLTLGSRVEGEYVILKARLQINDDLSALQTEKITNQFFSVINQYAALHRVVPIVDDSNLRTVSMICPGGLTLALTIALAVLAKIDSDNVFADDKEECNITFVVHKSKTVFTICGDENRYIPILFTPDMDHLEQNWGDMKDTGSRILITEDSYQSSSELDTYACRYIGKLAVDGRNIGIYDVYDDKTSNEIKLMKQTQRVFGKAMELYEKEFFYEAKNLFTMVLHENKDDKIAKYYVFQCERLQNRK